MKLKKIGQGVVYPALRRVQVGVGRGVADAVPEEQGRRLDQFLAEALEDRTLFVQGSIDLLCTFADGHMELCDYKTDHITPEERRDPSLLQVRMTESHRDQLLQYAAAVEEMYGIRPTKAYIFSLPLGEAVEIEV